MDDPSRKRGIAAFHGELRGIAFVAVLCLTAAAVSDSYYFGRFDAAIIPNYVPAIVTFVCLLLSYGKYKRGALFAWVLVSLFLFVTYLFPGSWGDMITDVGEVASREFHRYSYLGSVALCFRIKHKSGGERYNALYGSEEKDAVTPQSHYLP